MKAAAAETGCGGGVPGIPRGTRPPATGEWSSATASWTLDGYEARRDPEDQLVRKRRRVSYVTRRGAPTPLLTSVDAGHI
jgi:hypothetical protein